MGKNFLVYVGMVNVVKDLDVICVVLGDDKLIYLGYLYGIWIGFVYVEEFLQWVWVMIFDGVVDFNVDFIEVELCQVKGFQDVFNNYVVDCVKNVGCLLGVDLVKVVEVYYSLVDLLVDLDNLRISRLVCMKDLCGLSYSDVIVGIIMVLYLLNLW